MTTNYSETRLFCRTGIVFTVFILLLVPMVSSLEANDTEDLNPTMNVYGNSTIQEIVVLTSQTVIDTEKSNRFTNISNDTIFQKKGTENSHDTNETKELAPTISFPNNLTSKEIPLEETSNNTSSSKIQLMNEIQLSSITNPEKILPSKQPLKIDPTGKYVVGEVIVQYKPEVVNNKGYYQTALTATNKKINPKKTIDIDSKSLPGAQLVVLPENISTDVAVGIYSHDPNVLYAQPNYVYNLSRTPNDPWFNEQWAFHNIGQSVNGQPAGVLDADIDLPETWDTFAGSVGSSDVIIALIDSGIDVNHPDLQNNIWTNSGEMGLDSQGRDKRTNGVDDDGSEIIDDWHGWNLVDRSGNITDDTGHGTNCGGATGAIGNNAIGVSGVIWNLKIMPVKISNYQGYATDSWIMQGISRAYDNDARIFILSMQSTSEGDYNVKNFIRLHQNALFICAAGNTDYSSEPNNEITPIYPASWDYDNIISVASTNNNDQLSWFSHYGSNSVDLSAPGENIILPILGGGYGYINGTSISSPIVAGVAGLIKSINPSATPLQIKNTILNNVDIKSSLTGKVKSGGRLNAKKALDSVIVKVAPIPDFTADTTTGQNPLTVQFNDNSAGARINTWLWNFGDGETSPFPNPSHTYSNTGTYTVSLTLSNGNDNTTIKTNYITVSEPASIFYYIIPSFNSAQGSIFPSSIQSVQYGSSQTFTIIPTTGYQIADVIASGVSQGAISNYTFTNVQANSTISAIFLPASLSANFTATPTNGTAPFTVQFTDTSTGSPTSWNWSFGDGSYSIIQNVNHTYTQAGNYTVSLTVSNSGGSNTTILQNFITVMTAGSIPTISSITPATGINTGTVSITDLAGTNFTTGSTVALMNSIPVHKGSIIEGTGGALLRSPVSVFVTGNYAYVASEGSQALEIVNISNPASPVHKGSISDGQGGAILSYLTSVFVSGNYAYLTSESNALEIVDVSDPANPTHKGSITLNYGIPLGTPLAVYVDGNYAYVASYDSEALEIVDVSDPANPVHKGSIAHGTGGALLLAPSDVYVSGNYAYVTVQNNDALEIVNVSDPTNPTHKGSITDGTGGARLNRPFSIDVSGNYAYIVSYGNWLEIVDISDPSNPIHKGSVNLGTTCFPWYTANSVSVSGNTAYVADYCSSSLVVVDVSDPANPVLKGSISNDSGGALLNSPAGVYVTGNYAYVASTGNNALEILKIGTSIPATNITVVSPTKLTCTFDLTDASAGLYDVVVTDTNEQAGILANGFTITAPLPPAPVANFTATPVDGMTPLTVQFTDTSTGIVTSRNWSFGDGSYSTVKNATHTYTRAGSYNVSLTVSNGTNSNTKAMTNFITVMTNSTHIYSITPATGINTTTVPITNLSGTNFMSNAKVLLSPVNSNPMHKSSITYGTGGALLEWPVSVYVSGNYAYIASYDSWALEIVNVSNPVSPVHMSSISHGTGGANLQCPNSVYVSGSNAYVASHCGNALEVVDISNPANPTHKGSITDGTGGALLSGADNVYVSGNYAYVTSPYNNALEIVDVSDPANPTHEGSISNGMDGAILYQPHSVYVSGDYAYVASYMSNALEIINISNPANPTHKGSIIDGTGGALLAGAYNVYVSGDYAYVASYMSNALEVVDISNPANPTHKGSIIDGTGGALLAGANDVYISGDNAYVASYGSNALEIVDISNPANPVHKSSISDGTGNAILLQPYNVFVYNENAYVVNVGKESLEIVDLGTIHATNVTVVSSAQITGIFNLTNRISGPYNVVVTNTDGQTGILKNGFTVTSS